MRKNEPTLSLLRNFDNICEALITSNNVPTTESLFKALSKEINPFSDSQKSFIYGCVTNNSDKILALNGPGMDELEQDIKRLAEESHYKIKSGNDAVEVGLGDLNFVIVPLKYSYRLYGTIGISLDSSFDKEIQINYIKVLSKFLSYIIHANTFDNIYKTLITTELQNRISGEIHDKISSQMFSVQCSIHNIMLNKHIVNFKDLYKQLGIVRDSIAGIMKQIRTIIYDLNTRKNGKQVFFDMIRDLVNSMSQLSGVKIDLNLTGDEQYISADIKNILYRAVSETIANSMKHGNCHTVAVKLDIVMEYTNLSITDDGIGFTKEEVKTDAITGLGLYNIRSLIGQHKGSLNIISSKDNGTEVNITIPNFRSIMRREASVTL
jgi:signal transduction histidine kinase